jgi:flavin reductase (DIM6/NTAB) family NADH-FMN oxidoreductase RutF/pimeloyl-ACP methyl ester carboxylesterase
MPNPQPSAEIQSWLMPRKHLAGTAYIEAGSGEPVILIHGVGLNADAWGPQFKSLSQTHRVIALDMLGHGQSLRGPENASLDDFVKQLDALLNGLGIVKANIIGHSMGGLVAIGFAVAHPQKTLRLGVLNSVYKRAPEKRAAVAQRAREVALLGTVGNVEEPIERWFGSAKEQPPIAADVRRWLLATDPKGYHAAYRVFASSDDVFETDLRNISVPSLFATGELDINSSPEMAQAMASAVQRGKSVVLKGQRHMMNLMDQQAVTTILRDLLAEAAANIDPKDLRRAFGTFMTGVTVVTTKDAQGLPRGFTANSFSSVSLEPPLLLVCISKLAGSFETFTKSQNFAVNILAENQKDVSGRFASKAPDKFANLDWSPGTSGSPLIKGAVANFDCAQHQIVDAGDHIILIGRVISYSYKDASALGYARGGYFSLGLEQSAVNAASTTGRTEVGAILEADGKLVVMPGSKPGSFRLPAVGDVNRHGSASQLVAALKENAIEANLGFLFAVFENTGTKTQSIYYRGDAKVGANAQLQLLPFDAIPWDMFEDDAVKIMLRRYCDEREQGRFKIYSGDHIHGEVRELNG